MGMNPQGSPKGSLWRTPSLAKKLRRQHDLWPQTRSYRWIYSSWVFGMDQSYMVLQYFSLWPKPRTQSMFTRLIHDPFIGGRGLVLFCWCKLSKGGGELINSPHIFLSVYTVILGVFRCLKSVKTLKRYFGFYYFEIPKVRTFLPQNSLKKSSVRGEKFKVARSVYSSYSSNFSLILI